MNEKPDRLTELMESRGVITRLLATNTSQIAATLAERYGVTVGSHVSVHGARGQATEISMRVVDDQPKLIVQVNLAGSGIRWPFTWSSEKCRVMTEESA